MEMVWLDIDRLKILAVADFRTPLARRKRMAWNIGGMIMKDDGRRKYSLCPGRVQVA